MKRNLLFTAIAVVTIFVIVLVVNNLSGTQAEPSNADVDKDTEQPNIVEVDEADLEALLGTSFTETEEEALERFFANITEEETNKVVSEEFLAEKDVIAAKIAEKPNKVVGKIFVSENLSEAELSTIVEKVTDRLKEEYKDTEKEIIVEVETGGGTKVGTTIPNQPSIPEIQITKAEKLHALADIYPFLLTVKLNGDGSDDVTAIRVQFEGGETTQLIKSTQSGEYSIDENFYTTKVGPETAKITLLNGETEIAVKELQVPMRKN